mgnify:CR=1 FL=1
MATVIKRLTDIDARLAQRVSRSKIGDLIGRVYFQPDGSPDPSEVTIQRLLDQGVTSAPWATGTEQIAHRWDINGEFLGNYFVQLSDGGVLIPVIVDNQTASDDQTYVETIFRVTTEITPTTVISISS